MDVKTHFKSPENHPPRIAKKALEENFLDCSWLALLASMASE
jgi:hypothetical protein